MKTNKTLQPGSNRRSICFESAEPICEVGSKGCFILAFACSFVLLIGSASAQNYSIDWFTIDGGGGTSTGGVYSVSGTIGQPDAGAMSGGNFLLTGGFWSLYALVPTPGAPTLSILCTTTNTICVSWPVADASWQLQATTNLSTASIWTACIYSTNGANCIYVEPPSAGKKFFRLTKP